MRKVIDINEPTAKKLRDKMGCPCEQKDPKEFIACEYSNLDPHAKSILEAIHLHVCNLAGKNRSPKTTIGRPGKTARLLRGF